MLDLVSGEVILFPVPSEEERHFHVDESFVRICQQFGNHRVQDVLDAHGGDVFLGAVIILIHGLIIINLAISNKLKL